MKVKDLRLYGSPFTGTELRLFVGPQNQSGSIYRPNPTNNLIKLSETTPFELRTQLIDLPNRKHTIEWLEEKAGADSELLASLEDRDSGKTHSLGSVASRDAPHLYAYPGVHVYKAQTKYKNISGKTVVAQSSPVKVQINSTQGIDYIAQINTAPVEVKIVKNGKGQRMIHGHFNVGNYGVASF